MITVGDPLYTVYLDVPEGVVPFFAAIAALSLFLVFRAVWRTIAGG